MAQPVFIPVAVVGDVEAVIISVRDKITAQQYLSLRPGAPLPLIDSARGRVICIHKASNNPWDVNEAHVLGEVDYHYIDETPVDLMDPLTFEELALLGDAGTCPEPVDAAPVEGRFEVRRQARQKANNRNRY
jgi:hypothetical protein